MPTITQEMVRGYAHCRDSWCPGNEQEQVDAVRERSDTTYAEKGGLDPVPGIENTTFTIKFLNDGADAWGRTDSDMPNDMPCPHCGKPREISDQERPVYPQTARVVEGQGDQRFLLGLIKAGKIVVPGGDGGTVGAGGGAEVEALRREIAELRGFMAGMRGAEVPQEPLVVPEPVVASAPKPAGKAR